MPKIWKIWPKFPEFQSELRTRGGAGVYNDHVVDGRVCLAAGIDVGFARGLDEAFPRAGAELERLHVPAA